MAAQLARGDLTYREPMDRHVSWRAGGVAARCYVPRNRQDLISFVTARPRNEMLYVVGLGSNLLVRDGGLDATVVLMHGALRDAEVSRDRTHGTLLDVEAGVAAPKVARMAGRLGLEGAEFLAGIPGTLGGALAMNAGCYGSQTWDHVVSVTTLDRNGKVHVRQPDDYDIGYRHVALKVEAGARLEPGGEWFLSARLAFTPGSAERAREKMRDLLSRRVATQPLGQPNAGSVFRNPEGGFAARLIESCGLKWVQVGKAQVSPRHANFIVNLGGATACDIESLILKVQEAVWARQGVKLVMEVRIVGQEGKRVEVA